MSKVLLLDPATGLPADLGGIVTPTAKYARELVVTVAGTAVGDDAAFDATATFVSVIADKDIFFAKTDAGATSAADGDLDDRSFAAAGERRVMPWGTDAFWAVNAVAAELPKIRVEGWA